MINPILILTALEIEKTAVEEHLIKKTNACHPKTGTDYITGEFIIQGDTRDVVIARTDQTNVNAAIEIERAISYFNPLYALYVGVAGGIKDVEVGDVFIGQDIFWYDRGKDEKNNFKSRPKFGT